MSARPAAGQSDKSEELEMNESLLMIAVALLMFAIIAYVTVVHYRRERRRADLLRNLDHHDWCRWVRTRH